MMDVLEEILLFKKKCVEVDKKEISLNTIERNLKEAKPPLDFIGAIDRAPSISLIAEMKRKSPSAGLIRENFSAMGIARAYQKGGASALSILTESERFGGNIKDIEEVRSVVSLPLLRKDFVFDVYQIAEARFYGADAVLLIADMISKHQLNELVNYCNEVKIQPLVEIFSPEKLQDAVDVKARMIGINTRNLRTLERVPDNVSRLSPLIPKDRVIVAESGFKTSLDVKSLKSLGISAVLIGESLLKQENLSDAVRVLVEAGR